MKSISELLEKLRSIEESWMYQASDSSESDVKMFLAQVQEDARCHGLNEACDILARSYNPIEHDSVSKCIAKIRKLSGGV